MNYIKNLQAQNSELKSVVADLLEALNSVRSYSTSDKFKKTVENQIVTMNPQDITKRVDDWKAQVVSNHYDRSNEIYKETGADIYDAVEL